MTLSRVLVVLAGVSVRCVGVVYDVVVSDQDLEKIKSSLLASEGG